MKKKQILLINDMAGYGKVATAAMLPILSYMGHPTYNLPTALVSNTLDYGKFNILETTEYIKGVFPVWRELGFSFDAIATGFMASETQARIIAAYCREQAENGTVVYVDPIMGDEGKLYNGVTDEAIKSMREMVSVAHLVFPNYTEACYLTDSQYDAAGVTLTSEVRHKVGPDNEHTCRRPAVSCWLQPRQRRVFHTALHRDTRSFPRHRRHILSRAHRLSAGRKGTETKHTQGHGRGV